MELTRVAAPWIGFVVVGLAFLVVANERWRAPAPGAGDTMIDETTDALRVTVARSYSCERTIGTHTQMWSCPAEEFFAPPDPLRLTYHGAWAWGAWFNLTGEPPALWLD